MRAPKHIVLFAFAAIFMFYACEKEITVDLPKPDPKIVVEGYIFEGERPYVILSRNTGYFEPIDSASLINSFIFDGIVTVSDGTNTDTLTFQSAAESVLGFAYVKSNPTVIGQAGKTYTLTATADGQTVTSTTTIVPAVQLDSIRWKTQVNEDSLGFVWIYFTDPGIDLRGYRIMSRRVSANPDRNQPYFRTNFYFENALFAGQQAPVGFDQASQYGEDLLADEPEDPDNGYFRVGDTVQVRLCTIDKPYYDFLNSLGNSTSSNGSPFASPNNVIGNITGGLGGFGGHGVAQYQIVCAY
ncbi:MAG: DUF4249 domain-containing protein [Sphingobacteriales bacterium JAD_PAG50586_3]|nr:MAG: DUF4249 domain-containing protein [Sphingobacteriales bacterium JAD_PAG50586_3]